MGFEVPTREDQIRDREGLAARGTPGARSTNSAKYILLSNFINYVDMFAERFGVEVLGRAHPMQSATAENLTILNFGMGSSPWRRP